VTPFDLTDGVVLLSVPTDDDVDRITELCQDADVQRWTTIPSPYHRSDAEWFVRELVLPGWAQGSMATWGVRGAADAVLHGMVGVDLAGDAEVGYWMGPETRGRGWMTRAARLAVMTAFGHGVDHVRWKAIVGNDASWRVAQKLGVRLEGTVRRAVEQRGGWRDAWVGTLLPEELG
jgi:RimJ/RimL family protein N-acetyltransferase